VKLEVSVDPETTAAEVEALWYLICDVAGRGADSAGTYNLYDFATKGALG
jgi:hypothetical protein